MFTPKTTRQWVIADLTRDAKEKVEQACSELRRVFGYRMALGEGVFHKDFIYKMAFNIAHGPLRLSRITSTKWCLDLEQVCLDQHSRLNFYFVQVYICEY